MTGRRTAFLAVVMVCTAGIASARPAVVQADDGARRFVDHFGQQAIAIVKSPDLTATQRKARLRGLIGDRLDLPHIGKYVLGPYWNKATPAQRSEFQELFSEYVLGMYGYALKHYSSSTFSALSAKQDDDTHALVKSQFAHPDGGYADWQWRLRKEATGYKVIDVLARGASMAQTFRAEMGAVIARRGFDGLFAAMRSRI